MLGHFIGYSFGISRNKASTLFHDTALSYCGDETITLDGEALEKLTGTIPEVATRDRLTQQGAHRRKRFRNQRKLDAEPFSFTDVTPGSGGRLAPQPPEACLSAFLIQYC